MNRHDLAAAQLKARNIVQPRPWELAVMAFIAAWIGFLLATGGTF